MEWLVYCIGFIFDSGDHIVCHYHATFFMNRIDWLVLICTLAFIVIYGMYKSKTTRDLDGYFRGNQDLPWYVVLLSIMGTQASAITFLSGPGQAYTDGMRFVQYYFGLPLAMVVLSITFIPIFRKLDLYTAYEFLEKRFDLRTRTLTSFLFLISRGLSTGISVFAPSIILSTLMGWNIYWTNLVMGGLLIIYTYTGGAKAVAHTQKLQFIIIFIGLFMAGYICVSMLPEGVGFMDALNIGGKMGKMNIISTGVTEKGFNWSDRYNLFSGLIGGFFLALSYFGTDQSQVGRYLTAKTASESKLGILMNGIVKVPMQFFILMIGVLVFTFYQFNPAPLVFNEVPLKNISQTKYADSIKSLQSMHDQLVVEKREAVTKLHYSMHHQEARDRSINELKIVNAKEDSLRTEAKRYIKAADPSSDANDTNYIFLRFVVDKMPKGIVGLLIAVIFIASWGSIAAALNSLASASVVDFHKKFFQKDLTPEQDYTISRRYSLFWGVFSVIVAFFVTGMGSLIEAVNILGSLFYGVILGIFLVAFYIKRVGGKAVFWASLIAELLVILVYKYSDLAWLWLNVIGTLFVVLLGLVLELFIKKAADH